MFYPFDRTIARFLKACLALFFWVGGFGYLLLILLSDVDKDEAAVLFTLFWVLELLMAFLYLVAGGRGITLTQDALHVHRLLLPKHKVLPSEIGCICIVGWGPYFSTDRLTGYKIGIIDASFELERLEAFGPDAYISRTNNADGALLAAVSYHTELITELMSRYSCPIYVTDAFFTKFPDELDQMMKLQWELKRRDKFCVLKK